MLLEATSSEGFQPLLRVIDVSVVGPPGQGTTMLVLSDDTHFIIGCLRQSLRLGWSGADRQHDRIHSLVRLLDWETIEREGQAVVFIDRMTTYAQPAEHAEVVINRIVTDMRQARRGRSGPLRPTRSRSTI